jgi:3-hydroxyisobutyrate dehydrogenase-like beta-hydroxyacid dehydrogenase
VICLFSSQYNPAPVFGASPLAESGQVLFVLSGPTSTVDMREPFIANVMGRGIVRVGQDPSKALLLKTTGYARILSYLLQAGS